MTDTNIVDLILKFEGRDSINSTNLENDPQAKDLVNTTRDYVLTKDAKLIPTAIKELKNNNIDVIAYRTSKNETVLVQVIAPQVKFVIYENTEKVEDFKDAIQPSKIKTFSDFKTTLRYAISLFKLK